jgi:hypothetical protein
VATEAVVATERTKRDQGAVICASLSAWKKVVDAAVAGRSHYLTLAPSSIKTAVKHQLAWFANVKANHYSLRTPIAPMTIGDVKKITEFERTKCGIKFSNG